MAKILFVWELGLGYGHLVPYSPLIKRLREKQHQVIFASRDVGFAEQTFANMGVSIVQAPVLMHKVINNYQIQYSYAHLMHNLGFAELRGLFALTRAWRHIYHYAQPDLVIFDHSPTALLGARSLPFKRIISGSGFLLPPAGFPMPMMRYWLDYDQEKLIKEEQRVLANANNVLQALNVPPLNNLGELFTADKQFLLSFKELDHYPDRINGNYLGMFAQSNHGITPDWPAGITKKVYAYIHAHQSTEALLTVLAQGNFASIIYAPDVPNSLKNKYQSEKLRFSAQALDLQRVAADCHIAITNATFATTTAFLLHGIPVLVIPTNLERTMLTRRLDELGASVTVKPDNPDALKPAIHALFTANKYGEAAKAFSARYQRMNLNWQTEKMTNEIEDLLPKEKDPVKTKSLSKKKVSKASSKTGKKKKAKKAQKKQ